MDLHSAFNRIKALDLDKQKEVIDEEKLANLMSEFIVSIQGWAEYLQIGYIYPFDDLISHIDPNIQLTEDMKIWLNGLKENINLSFSQKYYITKAFDSFLRWCLLEELGKIPPANLPNPYQPFIEFLENGGDFHIEHKVFMTIYPNFITFILIKR
ncbi:MAG TPA: hypothetical protein VK203_13565 [Nostocaceae cyanobacterium]|nr:hypothetical protein [Nostocaceae cyanobacterium]